MKSRHIISIVTALLVFPLLGAVAQAASFTIDVLQTFDYPGTGNQTRPQKIDDFGNIAGVYLDSAGVSRGFVRFANGNFSAPIVDPNDTSGFTEGRGINNSQIICGDYLGSDGAFHGFFLSGSHFKEFDVVGATTTEVLGINNADDFVGTYTGGSGILHGFVSLGGTITPFFVRGSSGTLAYQLNSSNQLVGYYLDSAAITHGYFRDSNGTLRFPIDPSGSTGTILFGNNDSNWIVGRYADSAGLTHGLFLVLPNKFTIFDFPGSTFTSLNGINQQGFICGRYLDSSAIEHGILARVRSTPATDGAAGNQPSLVTPLVRPGNPAPSAVQAHIPAS